MLDKLYQVDLRKTLVIVQSYWNAVADDSCN